MLRVVPDSSAARRLAPFRTSAAPVSFGAGFYSEEREDLETFRWMEPEARLDFAASPAERFLELWVFSGFHDVSQCLTVGAGEHLEELALPHGWSRLSVAIAGGLRQARLSVNKPFPKALHPDDSRSLAVRVRHPFLHADPDRHRHVQGQFANAVKNRREMLSGQTQLESTPPHLGIDLHGVCNVKPPCVYCEWDWAKDLEGEFVDVPFTRETLEEWGELFDNSRTLVNCSIGEPFMMKNLDELFDIFGDAGKVLEMTTNGQILTDRNIEKLLDRDIELYISLDAAEPETYARLRNDRLESILVNLRRLIAAKGGRGNRPRIHLVFMPMRCNVDELEGFVKLCADLGVDRMVLRPLNYSDSITLKWERQGHVFDYQKELLPFAELVQVSSRAAELCRQHGVALSDQMDFGGSMEEMFGEEFTASVQTGFERHRVPPVEAAGAIEADPSAEVAAPAEEAVEPEQPGPLLGEDQLPACLEPWSSLYILRRGVLPCCYGGAPVADMHGHRAAWNSELLQSIRRELARGRFHRYCLDSPSCPIVRKSQHARRLPRSQAVFLRAREIWHRFDRRCFGVPGRIYRPSKWVAMRLYAAVTDPSYVPKHVRRLAAKARRGPEPRS